MVNHLKISAIDQGRIIVIESDPKIDGIYFFLKKYYEAIINRVFVGKDIKMVSINPRKDALCFEQDEKTEIKIGKDKVVINSVKRATGFFLGDAIDSLDFETGNIILAMDSVKDDSSILPQVYDWTRKAMLGEIGQDIDDVFGFCHADGYVFSLVNSGIGIEELKQMASLSCQ